MIYYAPSFQHNFMAQVVLMTVTLLKQIPLAYLTFAALSTLTFVFVFSDKHTRHYGKIPTKAPAPSTEQQTKVTPRNCCDNDIKCSIGMVSVGPLALTGHG